MIKIYRVIREVTATVSIECTEEVLSKIKNYTTKQFLNQCEENGMPIEDFSCVEVKQVVVHLGEIDR